MFVKADEEQKALDLLNPVFEILGGVSLDELPSARQGWGSDCVVARAFAQATGRDVYVGSRHLLLYFLDDAQEIRRIWRTSFGVPRIRYDAESEMYEVWMPALLQSFISHFDDGAFPHLIDEDTETVTQLSAGSIDGESEMRVVYASGGSV